MKFLLFVLIQQKSGQIREVIHLEAIALGCETVNHRRYTRHGRARTRNTAKSASAANPAP